MEEGLEEEVERRGEENTQEQVRMPMTMDGNEDTQTRLNGVVAWKIGCPLSANSSNICSAMSSQAPCGLFSEEYLFFSEPGPIKDHCPIPNLLESTFTVSAFVKHSSLLLFLSQEMSLNINLKLFL